MQGIHPVADVAGMAARNLPSLEDNRYAATTSNIDQLRHDLESMKLDEDYRSTAKHRARSSVRKTSPLQASGSTFIGSPSLGRAASAHRVPSPIFSARHN
jgi:hypothetical protein